MTRLFFRIAGRLGPPLLAVLLAGLVLSAVAAVSAVPPVTGSRIELAMATPSSEQCYAWEATNGTGQSADGLRVELTGVQTTTQLYTGAGNPFGEAGTGTGYDAGNDRYVLVLGTNAAEVGSSESIRVGACTPQVVSAVHFQWLTGGSVLSPTASAPSLAWTWPAPDALEVQVSNTTGVTITLLTLQVLTPESAIDIDNLNAEVAAHIQFADAELAEPMQLAPSAVLSSTFAFPADVTATERPALFAVQWVEGDDLAAVNTFVAQTSAPELPHIYLPAVNR